MAGHYDLELLAALLPLMTKPNPRLLNSGTYHLAELGGQPAGCGGWSMEAPGSRVTQPGIAHIRHFAAKREHSRKGIARAIYTQCEAEARAAGITTFICYASLNGEPFYSSLGFKRVGLIEVPTGKHRSFSERPHGTGTLRSPQASPPQDIAQGFFGGPVSAAK